MNIVEYKKTCNEFRRLASQMLRSTDEMGNAQLIRLRKFLEENPLISDIIKRRIEGVTCEEGIIYSTNGYWLAVKTPVDEAEQMRGIYDHLIEMTDEARSLLGIASKFHCSSRNINEIIRNYLDKVFKPLVDFIIAELGNEVIEMETSMNKGVNINIENNYGTNNIAQGNIQSTNVINGMETDINKIKVLVEEIIGLLQQEELDEEVKEEIIDDLETIDEQLNQEQPKKIKLKKACEGIKQFIGQAPQKLTHAAAIMNGMNTLLEVIGKVVSQFN
ncbi:MAG: hypothetical protein H9893_08140 [Candidatus Niameybacter stercoravium]|nr:hypothetical protein [Candidatus Niameybacter stercoravium]